MTFPCAVEPLDRRVPVAHENPAAANASVVAFVVVVPAGSFEALPDAAALDPVRPVGDVEPLALLSVPQAAVSMTAATVVAIATLVSPGTRVPLWMSPASRGSSVDVRRVGWGRRVFATHRRR